MRSSPHQRGTGLLTRLAVICLVGTAVLHAQPRVTLPEGYSDAFLRTLGVGSIRHALASDAPAQSWETASMAGNGRTGVLAMSRPQRETLIFSRSGLYLPLTRPMPPPPQGEHLPEIRRLLAAGDYQEAADLVDRLGEQQGYRGLHWTNPFVPVCSLEINLGEKGPVHDYARSIDYPTGVIGTHWRDDAGAVIQRTFVSRVDDVVVISLVGENRELNGALRFLHHDATVGPADDRPPPEAFARVEATASTAALRFESRFKNQWPGSMQGAEAAARVLHVGGELRSEGDTVHVRRARELLILVGVRGIRDFALHNPRGLAESLVERTGSYGSLLARHAEPNRTLFNRVQLDLGGSPEDHRLPARRLLSKSSLGAPLPALIEKQFDAARYLLISSAGSDTPPTLQGVWAGSWRPPWSGDFAHQGSLPVAISANLPAAMPELLEGFFKYHESRLPDYRQNARRMFNARGIVVPSRSSDHGLANHFGPARCHTFWTAGAAMVARAYFDYWDYTGNRDFLLQRALPFMKEVALFYEDFLRGTETPEGQVTFSPSYSPENSPANTGSPASVNATMDVVAARQLLESLVRLCEDEFLERENLPRWRALLARIPPYRINPDGAVAEWISPRLQDNYAHRHVSHLYELLDGLPDSVRQSPQWMSGFQVAVQKRTDWRRQVGGGEMAFGLAQMGAVAASLRLPELAYENLGMLSNWFWFPESLMTAHNPQSVFNTDIAGGMPHLIIRMLVDSRRGWIEVLPALPSAWPTGRITGILCRGQVTVRELGWSAKQVRAVLRSPVNQTIEIRFRGRSQTVRLAPAEDTVVVFNP